MKMNDDLSLTEELDFHYLLGLMPPLTDQKGFEWLPELFSIIGVESLIKLCKYAGGEFIRIPTLEELSSSVESLQWYYDVFITKKKRLEETPSELFSKVRIISEVYDARNC